MNDMSPELRNDFVVSYEKLGANEHILISDILCQIAQSDSIIGRQFQRNQITVKKIKEVFV